ncbi:MAG: helix-turn-helix transcriptional regulator [Rhodospirillaceae bacterium]|nr:helix-turn-helix transcriptional regulator [Rhodospirillaceae bacterium]
MLRHSDIWRGIDRLAAKHGLSPSGLARRSGLDPTAFNKSKRITPEGRKRWPSTESIAKVLDSTGESLGGFFRLIGASASDLQPRIPLLGYAKAGTGGYFDDVGHPTGKGWDQIQFPLVADEHAYALQISGDSMEPVYRDGDVIIVSPAASIRRGDRVVLKTKDGEILAKQLGRRSDRNIELLSLNPDHPDLVIKQSAVAWMARIIWASQ